MADSAAKVAGILLGGKGSSLSSSSVYAIANGLAQVRIASSNNDAPLVERHRFAYPDLLTPEECRASFVVLLNKLLLLLSGSSPGIRSFLPDRIAKALNSSSETIIRLDSLDLTEEEVLALETLELPSVLIGISAVLDHQSAALSTVVDVAAALSCEASKADVSEFNSTYVAKEEAGVARDMKVLLSGSKFVGEVKIKAVSNIPKIHGCLREQAKSVRSKTRLYLNSLLDVDDGGPQTLQITLQPLAAALRNLGNTSLSRVKMNVDAVSDDNLRLSLAGLFGEKCPSRDSLRNGYNKLVSQLVVSEDEENYVLFAREVNVLLNIVWKIVAWEVMTAEIALEGANLNNKSQIADDHINGGRNVKVEKKSEKKKKEKEVLLKGTRAIVQEIKERLQSKGVDAIDNLGFSDKWIDSFLSLLDPKDLDFGVFLNKMKEIVEMNETRRLPKVPKVMKML